MGAGLITSLLIANRGEIACRIIRTARRMGVRTIAVYSDADAGALHVREADEAVRIGPSPAAQSYLSVDNVLAAAHATGAAAIHPGYGFLSENAAFAEAVIGAGLVWVGPPPAAIRAMGLKDAAKSLMAAAGVPVTPGYLGEDQSPERLASEAAAIGYPVLIKAVAGGGGKGMRKVEQAEDFAAALAAAKREAAAAFGDDRVLLETYVSRPRHIEVQVFGDSHGNTVHLFERDCSLQRRHQKVIEEAPAPGMDEATRAAICDAAVKAARAVAYEGAGTIEFIADASDGLRADRIWFMEMNTRLQVEHPVTEAVTGLDLVEWQLRVASGEPLPLRQDDITLTGHAIEARLYAENPAKKFLPSTGPLTHLRLPTHLVRVDSGVEEGGAVTPFYDPMIAKLVAHGVDREAAAALLAQACRSVEIWPVKTNAGFLGRCLDHPDFRAGEVDTGFIDRHLETLTRVQFSDATLLAAIGHRLEDFVDAEWEQTDPWASAPSRLFGFRLNAAPSAVAFPLISQDGVSEVEVNVEPRPDGDWSWRIGVDGRTDLSARDLPATYGDEPLCVFENGDVREFSYRTRRGPAAAAASDGTIRSPMPGRIVSVDVAVGARVTAGQALVVLEAMKMEHLLTAPFAGVVEALPAQAGTQVEEGVILVRIVPA